MSLEEPLSSLVVSVDPIGNDMTASEYEDPGDDMPSCLFLFKILLNFQNFLLCKYTTQYRESPRIAALSRIVWFRTYQAMPVADRDGSGN